MITNGNDLVMPVAPMYGGNNGGFGGFGGDWGWIVLLLLLAGNGGWGNGFGGGFGNAQLGYDFPWLLNGQQSINANTNEGFRDVMLNDGITSIKDGINGISTQLCNGFAGVEQGANARQIANMQTDFAMQNAINAGFNNVTSQLAQCCCDNRLATCQTQNIVQSEGSATRFADANNTRDIIDSQTRGTQAILDKLCALELSAKDDTIANLRQELAMKDLSASQVAQNAFIAQGFSNEVDQLYNRLNNCPVPSTPVYGRTPIFTCNNNNGCGCGCGNF
jgi:hypothetical protein